MIAKKLEYTAVIRTLGKAGEKYQHELDSLCAQTIQPKAIIVYIAEGYPIPKETCGVERYVYVPKGMVAQRALSYTEVDTEYILFLDDDIELPPNFVEQMYNNLLKYDADLISPDIYPNNTRRLLSEVMMTLSGRMRARRGDNKYGYKVMNTAGYSYNKNPENPVYISNTNAGACFFCRKEDFLKLRFQDELWIDRLQYPIGEDQIMYYKMHLYGLKQLTWYNSGAVHLDGGNNLGNKDKEQRIVESDYFYRRVFFNRFLLEPEKSRVRRVWKRICIGYFYAFGLMMSLAKLDINMFKRKLAAINRANQFIASEEYKKLPKIVAK